MQPVNEVFTFLLYVMIFCTSLMAVVILVETAVQQFKSIRKRKR